MLTLLDNVFRNGLLYSIADILYYIYIKEGEGKGVFPPLMYSINQYNYILMYLQATISTLVASTVKEVVGKVSMYIKMN